jgi:hypothetical protein
MPLVSGWLGLNRFSSPSAITDTGQLLRFEHDHDGVTQGDA